MWFVILPEPPDQKMPWRAQPSEHRKTIVSNEEDDFDDFSWLHLATIVRPHAACQQYCTEGVGQPRQPRDSGSRPI